MEHGKGRRFQCARPEQAHSGCKTLRLEHLEARHLLALTLDLGPDGLPEDAGTVLATVTRTSGDFSQPLLVDLSSNDVSEATVPDTVLIEADLTSATFNLTVVDDLILDGDVPVIISASASGPSTGEAVVTILNNDLVTLTDSPTGDVISFTKGAQAGEYELGLAGAIASGIGAPQRIQFPDFANQNSFSTIVQTAGYDREIRGTGLVAVDTDKSYALNGWARSGDEFGQRYNPANEQSFGVHFYDVDYQQILPQHVYRFAGATDTTLAAPLNPGDNVIQLADATGWSNAAVDAASTRALAWYGYQDGAGSTYADYTYTRNVATGDAAGLWAVGGVSGNTVTLSQPWGGPALPAGAAVRNADGSGDEGFLVLDRQTVPHDWTWSQYTGVFGNGELTTGDSTSAQFRPGTTYIKPFVVTNQQGTTDNFIYWRSVSVTQVEAATTGADLQLPTIDLSTITAVDQRQPLSWTGDFNYSWANSLIQVDTAEAYTLSARINTENYPEPGPLNPDSAPLQFASLDVDMKLIHPLHVTKYAYATDTTLAANLNPGDTSLLITDASGWSTDPWESAQTRALAWYGYTDSTGHTYADYTYTRNVAFDYDEGLWQAGGISYDTDSSAYRVELLRPWSGPALAAGSAIRNAATGEVFNTLSTDAWQETEPNRPEIRGTIQGQWQQGTRDEFAFRPGTVYVQPVLRSSEVWADLSIGPAVEVTTLGPKYFEVPSVEIDEAWQFTVDLDVLGKGLLGGAPTVAIDSVSVPDHGTATIATLPDGTPVVRYVAAPSFLGTDIVSYTLRDTSSGETATSTIGVTVFDGAEDELLQRMSEISFGFQSLWALPSALGPFAADPDVDSEYTGLSWRVQILPYIGYGELYVQFNRREAWDSEHNLALLDQMPDIYRGIGDAPNSNTTRIQVFVGNGSPFNGLLFHPPGGLLPPRAIGPSEFSFGVGDGLRNTILFAQTGADVAVPWTKPDNIAFDPTDPLAGLGTIDETIYVMTADGTIRRLLDTIDTNDLNALVTIRGNEMVEAGGLGREYEEARGGPNPIIRNRTNHLGDLGLAMQDYESARNRFPSDISDSNSGTPLLSWRVQALPHLGYQALYDKFNLEETWDSPTNLALLDKMPDIFRSLGDSHDSTTTRIRGFGYQPGEERVGFTNPANPLTGEPQRGIRLAEVQDGTSHTIMLVEAGIDRGVPWTKPGLLPFDFEDPLATLGDLSQGNFRFLKFDGAPFSLSTDLLSTHLLPLATRSGRESVDQNGLGILEFYRTGGSEPEYRNRPDVQIKQIAFGVRVHPSEIPANIVDRNDGTPLLSWRVQVLPFIEQQSLYDRFNLDEPWDSPHNLELLQYMPNLFRSSGDPLESGLTRVTNFRGPNAPFELGSGVGPEIWQIIDGTSNTIAFAETGNAVPWTKPTDTPFHENNPFSALGDVGLEFITAMFDGSALERSSSISIDELFALITHNGREDLSNPPPVPIVPGFYVHQTGGDTVTHEFGVDWFEVVLDQAPIADVVLNLAISNAGIAVLDQASLTFTPDNWNERQRVAVRAVDNHSINLDQTVQITVTGPAAWGTQQFSAVIQDDDRQPIVGDFNRDYRVDSEDLQAWSSSYGNSEPSFVVALNDGDADDNQQVNGLDFLLWQINAGAAPTPGDFDIDNTVGDLDLRIWEIAYGVSATGDANDDGRSDGLDFLLWQVNRDLAISTPSPGDFNGDGQADGLDFLKWQREGSTAAGLSEWESAYPHATTNFNGDGLTNGLDFLQWQSGFPEGYSQADLERWQVGYHTTRTAAVDSAAFGTLDGDPLTDATSLLDAQLIDLAMAIQNADRSDSSSEKASLVAADLAIDSSSFAEFEPLEFPPTAQIQYSIPRSTPFQEEREQTTEEYESSLELVFETL